MGEYTAFLLLFLVVLCFETVSICTPDGPGIDTPPSASWVLELLTVYCHSYSLKSQRTTLDNIFLEYIWFLKKYFI